MVLNQFIYFDVHIQIFSLLFWQITLSSQIRGRVFVTLVTSNDLLSTTDLAARQPL